MVGGVLAAVFFITTLSFTIMTPGVGEASAGRLPAARAGSHMAEAVVLTGASVLVTTAPPDTTFGGTVSILVTGRALAELDLLIAKCCINTALANASGTGQRSYEMVTNPIRLDTLSGESAVVIRAIGVVERTDLVVAMRFKFEDQLKQRILVFHQDFGNVCLTAESPVATRRLPLRHLRSDEW